MPGTKGIGACLLWRECCRWDAASLAGDDDEKAGASGGGAGFDALGSLNLSLSSGSCIVTMGSGLVVASRGPIPIKLRLCANE